MLRRAARHVIGAMLGIGLLAFQVACGEPKPAPLASPDMTDGLVLSWVIGRDGDEGQFVPTSACRFEMTPGPLRLHVAGGRRVRATALHHPGRVGCG